MIEKLRDENDVAIKRMPVEVSSYHAVLEATGDHDAPPALVLAMHGYGQACRNFIKTFAPLSAHNVLVVAPQGLHQFYWSNRRPGFSWMTSHQREQTIADNLAYLNRLYDALKTEHTFDPNRVFLLGFSQGVAMAFRAASTGHIPACGVIACGGNIPPEVAENLDSITPYPSLVMHGRSDEVVPIAGSEMTVAALQQHNFPVDTHYFDGQHDIPETQVVAIAKWMHEH